MRTIEQLKDDIRKIPASHTKRHERIKAVLFELCELIEPLLPPEYSTEDTEDESAELDEE